MGNNTAPKYNAQYRLNGTLTSDIASSARDDSGTAKFHCLVWDQSAKNATVYEENGTTIGVSANPATIGAFTNNVGRIAGTPESGTPSEIFDGKIVALYIWKSTALSAAQIQDVYNSDDPWPFLTPSGSCPATCAGGRSARCITDISDASDPDNLLYGLSPAAVANEDTVCYDPSSVLGDTVNVSAAGWPSIASGGSQLTDSFDYCIMDNGAACGTDGTYEVTFQPVITSVTGIGTGQTTGTVTVTPAGPTEGTVRGVAILKSVYDLYGAPSHAQIAAGVDANYDGVAWGSEFTSDLATPDVWTNLLTRSNDINHGSWALNGSAAKTPNAAVSPSGDSDAVLVDVTSGTSWVAQGGITFTAVPHTYSIWARSVSGSGTYTLNWNDGSHHRQHVNLTTAWQRFSITFTPSATSNGFIYLADNRLAADLTQAYVWHPQLEAASTAGPYTPTTTAARARFDGYTFSRASSQTYEKSDGTLGTVTSGNPAFTYSGGTAQGVLLEGARTNLAKRSTLTDDLSNATRWVATGTSRRGGSRRRQRGYTGSTITTVYQMMPLHSHSHPTARCCRPSRRAVRRTPIQRT